jgi:hypothetical protein
MTIILAYTWEFGFAAIFSGTYLMPVRVDECHSIKQPSGVDIYVGGCASRLLPNPFICSNNILHRHLFSLSLAHRQRSFLNE